MDFDVNRPVVVTSLGAFDSGGAGFQNPVWVTLYNRTTKEVLAQVQFGPGGVPGTLLGGSRFAPLQDPVVLPAGFRGTIAMAGAGEPYGYWKTQSVTWTTDDLGGALAFVGNGRYNNFDPGFPATPDKGPANAYAAGTFLARPADAPVGQAGYDFGLKAASAQTGAIQGAVVLAPNQNGDPFAPGLPPLPGVRVYLDLNGDGHYTPGEPFAITDVHGVYRIGAVPPGTYLVKQDLPPSWAIRTSTPNGRAVVLGGQTAYAINFSDVKPGQQDPAVAFVAAPHHDVPARDSDAPGRTSWLAFLQAGGTRRQVAAGFWDSREHRGLEVNQFYATYLHWAADAAGRAAWVDRLRAGTREAEVTNGFLTSQEYHLSYPSTSDYLLGLYADVLGRAPDADGVDAWLHPIGIVESALTAPFFE
jgi:hypothetical protein